jgi:heme exporter protein A
MLLRAASVEERLEASLQASDLTCIRGTRLVFRGVNLRVESGQMLALEGPNGAGKTSLLRMIAGFLAPAAGSIRIRMNGAETADGEERGRYVGWLGHHDAAKPQLTPRETLDFFARLYGTLSSKAPAQLFPSLPQSGRGSKSALNPISDALQEVGVDRVGDLPSQYLSAGQRKRLALARLKMSARPLWLLDEPLAALDAAGKALAAQLIAAHCAAGGIVIAATHEPLGIEGARLTLG